MPYSTLKRKKPWNPKRNPLHRAALKKSCRPMVWHEPREGSHRAIQNDNDSLFSQYIIRRDGACVECGEEDPQKLTCGHLFGRVNENARWHPLNAMCQCKTCNGKHNDNKQPLFDIFIAKYGQEMFDDLYIKWNKAEKFTYIELLHLRDEFRAALGKEKAA